MSQRDVLREVGAVARACRYEASLYTRDGVDLTGPEQRALRQLHNALLIEPVHRCECGSDRELDPSDAGRPLLSRWDAEHPADVVRDA